MTEKLPRGQRTVEAFHRFGLTQFASRFPKNVRTPSLEVVGQVTHTLDIPDVLQGLTRVEQVSDFHCVTTWSVRALRWEGVRFADFFSRVIGPQAQPHEGATLVALRGQDGAWTAMSLEDLLAPDVLLADRLNGEPLSIEHGAPLRLVAPAHYGYKSVKHLCRLEFRTPSEGYRVSGFRFMDHPRARVAMEERGRVLPGWLLRYLYRPLIRPTVLLFAKASKAQRALAERATAAKV
jgi:DMSO/TMAO reductase YedYZ molybdopterin-dependent catalytic subunit